MSPTSSKNKVPCSATSVRPTEADKTIQALFQDVLEVVNRRVLIRFILPDPFFGGTSSRCLLKVSACSPGQLLQNVFGKHATAAEFESLVHQLKQYVLALLTDGRYVLHINNEFAVAKVCSRLFAGGS